MSISFQPPPSSRLKFQKYSKTIWQRNIQTSMFFLFCHFSHNTQMLKFSALMFQLTGGVSCTHWPCIFDIAFIYFVHHYILMCLSPVVPICQQYFFSFLLLLREKPGGDCQRVCHAVWSFSICASCLHLCVCVCACAFVSNRNHKDNDNMNRNRRDCTNRLLTAEADTLVQGISETVSVLA